MQATIVAAAALSLVAAEYGAPATVSETVAADVQYYYADYDNIVVTGQNSLWYSSSLSADAVARETGAKSAQAGGWSQAADLGIDASAVYNLKGATFCGQKDQWGKYTQVFVADAGDENNAAAVYGWKVEGVSEENPEQIQLVAGSKWTVYNQDNANVTDVECGPNNGLFVADKGNNAVYWITGAALANTAETPQYDAVIGPDCGGAVAEVRSLAYNNATGQLVWSNNAAGVDVAAMAVADQNAGVFQYQANANAAKPTTPSVVQCNKANCDNWSKQCSNAIQQVQAPEVENNQTAQYWAVANAWADVQVSQGDKEVYSVKTDKVVANVGAEATYAQATDADRNALLVSDQEKGAVYAVKQGNAAATEIAQVNNAYGIAYNAHGVWDGNSASTLALSFGAVLAVAALLF